MEKEQNPNPKNEVSENIPDTQDEVKTSENKEDIKEKSLDDKILELEDKLARTFAEMENQRRRFEKEKEEA